jgi:hypothetical protein
MLLAMQSWAQTPCSGVGVEVETYAVHDYPSGDPLESLNGLTTYRLYVTVAAGADFVSAIAGSEDFPLSISTSTSFYQTPLASVLTGGEVNPGILGAFPTLAYDSWVTIGRTSTTDPGGSINAISGLVDWIGAFEGGSSIEINDLVGGGWFALNGDVNGIAGDDLKVLIGQFTTDGVFSGSVFAQIFPNSVGADEFRCTIPFDAVVEIAGCTNADACNYDSTATVDDGSCQIVNAGSIDLSGLGETCSGDGFQDELSFFYSSIDQEGSSAAWVVTDQALNIVFVSPTSANSFNSIDINFEGYAAGEYFVWYATFFDINGAAVGQNAEDLSGCFDIAGPISVFVSAAGCNDPLAINYNADACGNDGSCMFTMGCTDDAACNYDPAAVIDDGSCVFGNCDCVVVCPEDITISCEESTSADATGMPTVSGQCNYIITMGSDVIAGNSCDYTITRTWSVQEVTGAPVTTCTQEIRVQDLTGPVVNVPEDVLVQCIEEVPAPQEVSAEDACNDVTSIEIFTSETGFPIEECVTSTAFGPGNDWAVWLPTLHADGITTNDAFIPNGPLTFVKFNDGTAHLFGNVVNASDATQGFDVDFWFENGTDWTGWSAQGRLPKDDLNLAAAGGNLWTTWDFFEMVNGFSTLTGTGSLAGSTLSMYHMPSNYMFGFQCGLAANNKNSNFGMSGWFTYDGVINGEQVEGHGDVNVDKECVPSNEQECVNDDSFTYMYRAVDSCGNATIASYQVIVHDDMGPEFTVVPEDLVVECDMVPVPVFEGVEAVDNCDCGVTQILYLGESDIEGDNCNYSFTRTWAAFDCCGNRSDYFQTITVVDTTAPEFTYVPAEATFECSEEVIYEMAEGTDNCGTATVTVSEEVIEGDCPNEYTLIRTFTITDECLNANTATQTINVEDTTAPVFGDFDVYVQVECTDASGVEGPMATDNCGEVTITYEDQLQSGGCLGVIVRTYTATDECGNSVSVEQYISLQDTTAPVIEAPADMTVECDAVPAAPGAEGIEIYDNCGLEVEVTFTEEVTPGICENAYTIVWTWTAVDYCENMSMATTTITVQDTTNPVFVEGPADVTVECSDELPGVVYPIATDNCDEDVVIEMTEETLGGDCPQEYTLQRIYRAFDNCGNQAIYVQNIYVVDTTAPMFPELGMLVYECSDEIPVILPAATDNCDEIVDVVYADGEIMDGNCPQAYSFERTYTATDDCGNSSTASQMIYVEDTTAPVFDAYEVSISMPCDNIEGILLTATDNCGNVEVSYNDTQVSGGCAGHIIRDFVAVDECGNEAYAQQVIILVDEVAPVITSGPEDMVIECDQEVPGCNVELISYEDNCTEVDVTCADEVVAGDCPQEYTITRTYTAEDNCGNASTYVQTISVVDTTAPYFEFVAESVTIECDQDVPAPAAEVADNCGDATWTVSGVTTPGECVSEYVMVRTYTATDACGNTSTAEQTITVVDTTAPEFTFVPGPVTLECDQEMPAPSATATDNCSEPVVSHVDVVVPGQCANEYTVVRTYSATDACGNVATAEQSVSFIDTTAPVFDAYTIFNQIQCDEALDFPMLTATDNCGEVTITCTYTPVSGGCAGNIIRDCVATDACGNTATAQQIFQLVDNTAPVFVSGPEDMIIECGNDVPGCDIESVVVQDNCTSFEVTCSDEVAAGDCPAEYTITRTYTAIDNCMNMSTYVQTISVVDTTMPWIEYMGEDATIECDQEIPAAEAYVGDNCGEATWTASEEIIDGECPQAYTIVRTYNVVDECGNTNSAVQTIVVVDTTAPYFVSVAPSVTIECDQDMPVPAAEVADNCGDATWTVSGVTSPGQCANEYVMVRTYTATDACGNTATAEQVITIVDTTAPFFISVAPSVTIECDQDMPAPAAEVGDNCGDATWTVSGVTTPGECANEYVMVRTYVATDACGNMTEATQTITVIDTTAPVFTFVAGDVTVQCDQELPAPAAQVTDNCGDATWTVSGVTTPGACANEYVMVRTYVAVDACGNMTEATQTISVVDTVAPEFMEYGESVTIECTMEIPAPYSYATDNCDEQVDIVVTEVTEAGDCPQEYTITRTYTATDDCGNSASVDQVITVVDTTAPMFTSVPENNEISCDANLPTEIGRASCRERVSTVV